MKIGEFWATYRSPPAGKLEQELEKRPCELCDHGVVYDAAQYEEPCGIACPGCNGLGYVLTAVRT